MPESVAVGRVSGCGKGQWHPPMSHHSGHCAEGTGTTLKVPPMPITGTSTPKRCCCCCCVGILCWKLLHKVCRGSSGASEQFQGVWWFWVATGLGLNPRESPQHCPAPLPVNHPWGARLPQRESRWGVSGGFGIHGASLGSPEPLAASPLPQGKRKRGRN